MAHYAVGWAEKWKYDILKYADVEFYGTIYVKPGSIEKQINFQNFSWALLHFEILKDPL